MDRCRRAASGVACGAVERLPGLLRALEFRGVRVWGGSAKRLQEARRRSLQGGSEPECPFMRGKHGSPSLLETVYHGTRISCPAAMAAISQASSCGVSSSRLSKRASVSPLSSGISGSDGRMAGSSMPGD